MLRQKPVAGLLGLLFGGLGLHRLYLGLRWWWIYPLIVMPAMGYALRQPVWFRDPAAHLAGLMVVFALLETILFCLTPLEKWDPRFNPGADRSSGGGGLAVAIAIVALMLGTVVLMTVLAVSLEGFFTPPAA